MNYITSDKNGYYGPLDLVIMLLAILTMITFILNFVGFFPAAFGVFLVCAFLLYMIFSYTGDIVTTSSSPPVSPYKKVSPSCVSCNGTGRCKYCYGTGRIGKGSVYGSKSSMSCAPCSSSGACRRCEGTGVSK